MASALAGLIASGPVFAQSKTGTSVGEFLLIEPSARIAAMGNAGVSVYEGLQAAYYNPAVIGTLERWEVSFSHAEWLAGISYDFAAAGVPLGRWGNVYGSVTALNSGDIAVRTVQQPLGTGELFSVNDVALGFGYGFQVTDRVSAGVQVNYVQETIWHSSAGTFTLNVGTLYRLAPNGLHLGASLSNFGTGARFSGRDLRIVYDNDPSRFGDNGQLPGDRFTQSYPVPLLFRVGVGMPWRLNADNKLFVAADGFHPSDNTESMSFGTEWSYRNLLALRAGYQRLMQEDSEVGLTLGAGVQGKFDVYGYRVDYAWADQGRLAGTHRITLGLRF
jgi:long-subunit fatty acid transport protein